MTTATRITIPSIDEGAREGLWFIDSLATVQVRGEETQGAMAVVEMISPAQSMPPLHVHQREDETFYVLEGEMEFYVGGADPVRVAAGGCIVAPRGVPHVYKVTSSAPARYLVAVTPAGFERFVDEVGDPAPDNSLPPADVPPDMGRIMAAAAAAGVDILGPPGALPGDA
jgi:quercetin dioxygenase-like cupin family protein